MEKMKVVIVTGLSGAGKTNAADWFEDQGYYCVDNMPPALIRDFIDLTGFATNQISKAAFVVDVRGGEFFSDLIVSIDELAKHDEIDCKILFIEASDETLIKRYSETRRSHPLASGSTTVDVITQEREKLREIRERADYIIDTTGLKVAGFKNEMDKIFFQGGAAPTFTVNIMSFGFKHGIPLEADLVFDMRFIPNPYYIPSLKKLTGNNKKVSQYVLKQPITGVFIKQLDEMIGKIIPCYMKEGKNHLNLAFGCTGGQHRSVTLANEFYRIFKEEGYRVTLEHKEL